MESIAKAICILINNDTGYRGTVNFEEQDGKTKITGTFKYLPPGKHGIHIHEFGDLSNGCVSAGAHFNPYKKTHGGPSDEERHVGDLGNVEADAEGNATFELVDHLIKLSGEHSIIGRSLVVHGDEDDLGRGNFEDSKTTGHAGARIICGIIGVRKL
jgi:Cu-Zn family superoxide dismutase